MKKLIFGCLLVGVCATWVHGQNFKIQMPLTYNRIPMTDEIPGKEGSPYLSDKWLPGTILLTNGSKIDGLTYRYSVYRKEMEFQKENTAYAIEAPDSIKELWINNRLFIYLAFTNKNKTEKDFFEVVIDGKAKLLIRYVIETIPANYNEALAVGNKNDQISIKETYYLQKNQETPFRIDKKGNNVVESMSDKSKEMKDFLEKKKTSFKDKNDLMQLIGYYNRMFK